MAITVIGDIDAAVDVVWGFIGDFAGLARWNPNAVRVDVAGEGVGTVRTVHSSNGTVVTEELQDWKPDEHHIAYQVTATEPEQPIVGLRALITLAANKFGGTRVTWIGELPPDVAEDGPLAEAVRQGFGGRIDMLRSKIAADA